MLLGEYVDPFLEHSQKIGRAEKTLSSYRRMLRGPLSVLFGMEVGKIKKADALVGVAEGSKYGRHGRFKAAITLRVFLGFVVDCGEKLLFDHNGITEPKVPCREPDWLENVEVEALRCAMNDGTENGLRTRAMFELAVSSGIRIGEAITLLKDDIDYQKLEICLENNKGGKIQKVYFSREASSRLKDYLGSRGDASPFLFVSKKGAPMPYITAAKSLESYARKSRLQKRIHWHITRKTFVTRLLFEGVDIRTVQHLARHESPDTTLRHYAAVSEARAKSEYLRVWG
jgi:site-specific recombinase XerD